MDMLFKKLCIKRFTIFALSVTLALYVSI